MEEITGDAQRICESAVALWNAGSARAGRPPCRDYLFMLNAVDDAYGGLEHRNSTALIAARKDLPRVTAKGAAAKQADGYTTLLGLISHEYFHTWNVKRLRPAEFAHYDYGRENYTGLLWFFEGFTSYYDDLLLRRAGLVDDSAYLRLLTKGPQEYAGIESGLPELEPTAIELIRPTAWRQDAEPVADLPAPVESPAEQPAEEYPLIIPLTEDGK